MTPVACYLDVEAIVGLAQEQGVDVIHPGYGFLAENARFARRCEEQGIAFVGPRPETIEVGPSAAAVRPAASCAPASVDCIDVVLCYLQ